MLLATGHEFFIMSYTHGDNGHVHMAQRVTINGVKKLLFSIHHGLEPLSPMKWVHRADTTISMIT